MEFWFFIMNFHKTTRGASLCFDFRLLIKLYLYPNDWMLFVSTFVVLSISLSHFYFLFFFFLPLYEYTYNYEQSTSKTFTSSAYVWRSRCNCSDIQKFSAKLETLENGAINSTATQNGFDCTGFLYILGCESWFWKVLTTCGSCFDALFDAFW